ncbi:MAG: MarR family winged helix-turn-helix transcriptional regulator [Velocimicrobium sp.]
MAKKNKYEALKLENQLCFPLYASAKEVVRQYKPFLDALDLTYTQYITMMVMWEKKEINVKELGEYLYLDSGTLTPLLKKLETKGYITRNRSSKDERHLDVVITPLGVELREQAVDIPQKVGQCICLEPEEAQMLYKLLYKMIHQMNNANGCKN